jgi:hypothetical protein
MARTAKCRICGKQLNTSEAYKIEGKPTKYYCSEQEFRAEEERKKKVAEDKDRVYTLICRIIGRETIINTSLFAEWKIWSSVADDTKIGQFLAENEEYLTGMISRLADAEFPRIRYLSTVLKNRLGDYKPKVVNEQEKMQPKIVIDETVYEAPTHSLNKRRSLADLEDELW